MDCSCNLYNLTPYSSRMTLNLLNLIYIHRQNTESCWPGRFITFATWDERQVKAAPVIWVLWFQVRFPRQQTALRTSWRWAASSSSSSSCFVFFNNYVTQCLRHRSQWPCCLRRRPWSLGRWDRGFEFRFRQGCLYSSFSVVLSCVGRGLRRAINYLWDFKFSRRRVWISELSSGMYCRVNCRPTFQRYVLPPSSGMTEDNSENQLFVLLVWLG
jgi:hypothetical protein